MNMMLQNFNYDELSYQLQAFHESSLIPSLDLAELNELLTRTDERYYNSTKLLNDFRQEAMPYIKRIGS